MSTFAEVTRSLSSESRASERVTLEELAEAAGTINYEMTCSLGMRLERVYR